MDKVQIYCAIMVGLNLALGVAFDGKPRPDSHYKFTTTFISLLISLPFYGRIFGWW